MKRSKGLSIVLYGKNTHEGDNWIDAHHGAVGNDMGRAEWQNTKKTTGSIFQTVNECVVCGINVYNF